MGEVKQSVPTHALRDQFTSSDPNSGGTTFYAKISDDPCLKGNYAEMPDSPDKNKVRNELALSWLKGMFTDCYNQLIKKHPQLADGKSAYGKREKLRVVVVVDDCGWHLELLCGFIAVSKVFQQWVSEEYNFGGVLPTFVGAGLDLAVVMDPGFTEGCDTGSYNLITLEPWSIEKALLYGKF